MLGTPGQHQPIIAMCTWELIVAHCGGLIHENKQKKKTKTNTKLKIETWACTHMKDHFHSFQLVICFKLLFKQQGRQKTFVHL